MPPIPSAAHRAVPGTARRSGPDACPTALQVHAAADGGLARVRIPGGLLTAGQARVLARAARDLGDGHLDLTSRGNFQLRGLPDGAETALGERLAAAGLLPSQTHERARNIVASPLTGLDGGGRADVRAVVIDLDARLRASAALAGLSGRFLFAVDDGRGDVAALGADVCLVAVAEGEFALLLDGGDHGLRCTGAWLAVAAAEAFLAERSEQGSSAWRMSEIDRGAARVAARLAAGAAADASAAYAALTIGHPPAPPIGAIPQTDGRTAAAVIVPLGRLSARQLDLLADLATTARGELRVTPWRGVVVPGLPGAGAPTDVPGLADVPGPADLSRSADLSCLGDLAAAGLAVSADSPWYGVTACAGRPGCAKSRADVRADATTVTLQLTPATAQPPHPDRADLPVHWVGCERSCGHPAGPHVRVLATGGGYEVSTRNPVGPTHDHIGEVSAPAAVAAAVRAARNRRDGTAS